MVAKTKERVFQRTMQFSLQEGGRYALKANYSNNCDCHNGELRAPLQWVQLVKTDGSLVEAVPANTRKIAVIKVYDVDSKTYSERFCAFTESGEFFTQASIDEEFESKGEGFYDVGIVRFADPNPSYRLAILMENAIVLWKDDDSYDVTVVTDTKRFGCYFKHRIFVGVKPSKLIFSEAERAENFIESMYDGGTVAFPNVGGEMVGIHPFGGYLYLFFEYGILRLDVGGEAKQFVAKEVEYSGGRILGRTIQKGGRGIYFMAMDGAYSFNGERVEKVLDGYALLPTKETDLDRSGSFHGRILFYYLTDEGYKTLVLYEDKKDGFYMDGLSILTAEEGGRCLFTDETGHICQLEEQGNIGRKGVFLGAETNWGVEGRKTLTKLRLEGVGELLVTVRTEGRVCTRRVCLQGDWTEVPLSERGEVFRLDFMLEPGTQIKNMTAELKKLAG